MLPDRVSNPGPLTYESGALPIALRGPANTVDSRYLEVEGTLWNTSRYPYFDISDVQNWGKYQSNNQISQMNM